MDVFWRFRYVRFSYSGNFSFLFYLSYHSIAVSAISILLCWTSVRQLSIEIVCLLQKTSTHRTNQLDRLVLLTGLTAYRSNINGSISFNYYLIAEELLVTARYLSHYLFTCLIAQLRIFHRLREQLLAPKLILRWILLSDPPSRLLDIQYILILDRNKFMIYCCQNPSFILTDFSAWFDLL